MLVKKMSPSNGAENASAEFVDFKKTRVPGHAKFMIFTNHDMVFPIKVNFLICVVFNLGFSLPLQS